MMEFEDRTDAGRQLAGRLHGLRGLGAVVLGLPRGGVAVARPIADTIRAPLDVLVARKIGAPGYAEFAIGAVTARGTRVLNEAALRHMYLPPGYLERATAEERQVAEDREARLRGARPPAPLAGRIVVLVDDGVATGMTMAAAIADARAAAPARLIVAVPVIAPDAARWLEPKVELLVALAKPDPFIAVGMFYRDFRQVDDNKVRDLLSEGSPQVRINND